MKRFLWLSASISEVVHAKSCFQDLTVGQCLPVFARGLTYRDRCKVVKVREVLAMLKDEGWVQIRQTGSHRQIRHPSRSGGVTVAGHPSRDLPPGIVNSTMK